MTLDVDSTATGPEEWIRLAPREHQAEVRSLFRRNLGKQLMDVRDEERMRDLTDQREGAISFIWDQEMVGYSKLHGARVSDLVVITDLMMQALRGVWDAHPYGRKIQSVRDTLGALVVTRVGARRRRRR